MTSPPAPPESAKEREQKAADLAYEKGTKDAKTDAHLRSHEQRLNAINGSIDKMTASNERVEARLVEIEQNERTRDAVARATAKSAQDAADAIERQGKAQVGKRQYFLGVGGVIVSIAALYLSTNPPS